jgi:hypothetical protein
MSTYINLKALDALHSEMTLVENEGYGCARCLDPRCGAEKGDFYLVRPGYPHPRWYACSKACALFAKLSQTGRPQSVPKIAGNSNWSFKTEFASITNAPDCDLFSLKEALTLAFSKKHITISCVNEEDSEFLSQVSNWFFPHFCHETCKVIGTGFPDDPKARVCRVESSKILTFITGMRSSQVSQPEPFEVEKGEYNKLNPHVSLFGFIQNLDGKIKFVDQKMTNDEITEGKWIATSEFVKALIESGTTINLQVTSLSMKKLGRDGKEFF